jgi:DNA topoisomerase VI subunit B
MRLERTTFETSRAREYFDSLQLSALTGVPTNQFDSVVLKESIDNALDACEMADVAPEIDVVVDRDEKGAIQLMVSDNGLGIPPEVVRKVLDYDIRVSDKAAYRSPTRGAQGNALQTVIGIPYGLGVREPVTITAQGVRHTIQPRVDPAGSVHIAHAEEAVDGEQGTRVSLQITPGHGMPEEHVQDFDARLWARSFAAFNPHATFRYLAKTDSSEEVEIYKSTRENIKKYLPSQPTSPHWYSAESLRRLIFSHIAHAKRGGNDLPLGKFVRQFRGLTSTVKASVVCSRLSGFKHLSDFEEKPEAVAELLAAMQAGSKAPKASTLGHVGEEHFRAFFEHVYEVKEFRYRRSTSTLPSGLPFTFEFALATLDEPGHLFTAINYSPTFGDPLEGTTLAGPQFKASGIRGFLSQGHALPKTEGAWYFSPTSVAVAAHIITPAPTFLDRGKTRLNMESA